MLSHGVMRQLNQPPGHLQETCASRSMHRLDEPASFAAEGGDLGDYVDATVKVAAKGTETVSKKGGKLPGLIGKSALRARFEAAGPALRPADNSLWPAHHPARRMMRQPPVCSSAQAPELSSRPVRDPVAMTESVSAAGVRTHSLPRWRAGRMQRSS